MNIFWCFKNSVTCVLVAVFLLLGNQEAFSKRKKRRQTRVTASGYVTDIVPRKHHVRKPRIPERLKGRSFGKAKYALVISLDGIPFGAFHRFRKRLPTMYRLAKKGFWRPLYTVFPSVTLSSHVSMVTGQYPRHHGVLGNRWVRNYKSVIFPFRTDVVEYARRKRTYSLYDLTARKKWKTAAVNWPATQRARITYNMPEIAYSTRYSYYYLSKSMKKILRSAYKRFTGKKKVHEKYLKGFINRLADSEQIDTDFFVRDLTLELIRKTAKAKKRRSFPRLMLVHFLIPDTLQHTYGPDPWVQKWTLELCESMIAKVIKAYKKAGIWKKTVVFLVSDHGFAKIKLKMDLRLLFKKKRLNKKRSMRKKYRKKAKVWVFNNGHTSYLYIRPEDQKTLIPKVLKMLRTRAYRKCIEGVYLPSEYKKLGLPIPKTYIPAKPVYAPGKHPGAPTLLVLAKQHCAFTNYNKRYRVLRPDDLKNPKRYYGTHGYFPRTKSMSAVWIASGPGIRKMGFVRKPAETVDLAPTLAHLMGLRWPRKWPVSKKRFVLDGRIRKEILKR